MVQSNEALKTLHAGKLPRMVSWYDPRLLVQIGIRTAVSSVFGQYADQRLIQAATDPADHAALISRYDYRDPTPQNPLHKVALDDEGAFFIDYIADTGDGFESTYAMAYLMAIDALKVPGMAQPLRAGDTLIMGGDQCYPQATREDYRSRLVTPFSWAFDVHEARRKLFAIPGNHDWYDGLNAFDSLFCASRDKLSEGNPTRLGGWQCQQHRSYWALRLPYNWWIWGTDIQFSKYLDAPQVNYFELIASQMGPEDNLIICIAEPSWLITDLSGEDEDENFFKITAIARKHGVRICAVIAGDWHHYNRYYSSSLDVHFLTAGGGGSFLHPTHTLKDSISVAWPQRVDQAAGNAGDKSRRVDQEGWQHGKVDISMQGEGVTAATPLTRPVQEIREAVEGTVGPMLEERVRGKRKVRRTRLLRSEAPTCYPSRGRSRLLGLRSLAFPLQNIGFALGIGIIYWLITWEFYSVTMRHDISAGKIDTIGIHSTFWDTLQFYPLYLVQATVASIPLAAMLLALFVVLIWYVHAPELPRWKHWLAKIGLGVTHFAAHMFAMFALGLAFVMVNNLVSPRVETAVNSMWQSSRGESDVVSRAIKEAIEPITTRRVEQRDAAADRQAQRGEARRPPPPAAPAPAPEQGGATLERVNPSSVRQIVGFVFYPLQIIVLGGLVGGFIWGLYWVVSSTLFRTHGEDAFAGLRITDYRNFLRMRFERDRLTIYPIGIDRIPKQSFWRQRGEASEIAHNPALEATGHIDVRLIEKPIVIEARPKRAQA